MVSAIRRGIRRVVRAALFAATALCLLPSTSVAQYPPLLPNELSVGLGVLRDQSPLQLSPEFVGAFAFDYDEKWRAAWVLEAAAGPTSEAGPCRQSPSDFPDNCVDAAVLGGLRFRPTPHAASGAGYFVNVLVGQYWKGSGTRDHEFTSSHFATQVGGGVEFRWPDSIQGVRVSVDYRHVFAGDRDRSQFRLLGAYVIGPRRFTRRPTP